MCKFTNRLFVFGLLAAVALMDRSCTVTGAPTPELGEDTNLLLELFRQDNDYDLHYDQRQKGSENLRLKMDGFFIGLPEQKQSSVMSFTDELLDHLGEELLLGLGKDQSVTAPPDNSLKYNVESVVEKFPAAQKPFNTIVVQIPKSKKENEARRHFETRVLEDSGDVVKKKQHIYNFLNLLKRHYST